MADCLGIIEYPLQFRIDSTVNDLSVLKLRQLWHLETLRQNMILVDKQQIPLSIEGVRAVPI